MDETLTAIEKRIQSLEDELSALPEFQKLQELKAFKAKHLEYIQERQRLLGGEEPSSVALDAPAPPPLNATQEEGTASTITTPTDRIILTVRKILEAHGKPMPIAALHDELDKRNIVIGGAEPRANLSTKLSGAKGKVYNAKPFGC
jgi:hypothetical protein